MKALSVFVFGLIWSGIAVLWYGIRRNGKKMQKEVNDIVERNVLMMQNQKLLEKMYADLQKGL